MFNDKELQRAVLAVMLGEKKMDPVGQEDPDIDNDGDVDSSDKYLHNRRKAIKKSMNEGPVDKAHYCATHVEHAELGKGTCITEAHADPDEEGNIAWYTVQFESAVKKVDTADLKILQSESHMHSKKKKMSEGVEELDEMGPGKLPRIDKAVDNEIGAKLMADFKARGGEVKQVPSPALPKNRGRMVAKGSLASPERRVNAQGGKSYVALKNSTELEGDQLDELKRSTLTSYINKVSKLPAYKSQGRMAGVKRAGEKIRQMKEDEDFDVDETIVLHNDFEVSLKEAYIFGDFLQAAKKVVGEEMAVELANYAFKEQDETLFLEAVMRSDIESRVKAHQNAGHAVTMPKYSTKGGQPHAEYVVTDKDSGVRRKYIHHGNVRRVENMGTAGKRD